VLTRLLTTVMILAALGFLTANLLDLKKEQIEAWMYHTQHNGDEAADSEFPVNTPASAVSMGHLSNCSEKMIQEQGYYEGGNNRHCRREESEVTPAQPTARMLQLKSDVKVSSTMDVYGVSSDEAALMNGGAGATMLELPTGYGNYDPSIFDSQGVRIDMGEGSPDQGQSLEPDSVVSDSDNEEEKEPQKKESSFGRVSAGKRSELNKR
jgi:hypothetical protein